jgi:hypothetical protein
LGHGRGRSSPGVYKNQPTTRSHTDRVSRVVKKETRLEIELLQQRELLFFYNPDGYRCVTLLLYGQDAKARGEDILKEVIKFSLIESDRRSMDHLRGFILFETPFKKTFAACIGHKQSDADPGLNEQEILRANALETAARADSPEAQFVIRSTCYDFEEAQRLMSIAGVAGHRPLPAHIRRCRPRSADC